MASPRTTFLRPTARTLHLALVTWALLAACGVTGEATDPDTPEPDRPMVERPSLGELAALLPDADDLGSSYRLEASHEDDSDDEDSDPLGVQAALSDACGPVLADWLDAGDASGGAEDKVFRAFRSDRDQTVDVDLGYVGRDVSDDQLSEVIDAIASCDSVTLDADDGAQLEVRVSASSEPDIGDRAIRVFMDVTLHHDDLLRPVTLSSEAITYTVGPVTVGVMVTDGFDELRLRAVAGDVHLVDSLAEDLEDRVRALLGG